MMINRNQHSSIIGLRIIYVNVGCSWLNTLIGRPSQNQPALVISLSQTLLKPRILPPCTALGLFHY